MHSQWAHPIEGLCLKLEEVKQIRSTVTMGDVEKFRHQKSLHNSLQKGKICFVCKIRKFGIFTWSYNCPLCMRNVCFRCLRKCTVSDDVSLVSDSNSDLSFLNLPAHALTIDMREIKEDVKSCNDIKVCLDCIDMLMHIKSSSRRTIEVAHHVQENLNQQKQKFEARLDKKKRR